jgi:hypothetical protein
MLKKISAIQNIIRINLPSDISMQMKSCPLKRQIEYVFSLAGRADIGTVGVIRMVFDKDANSIERILPVSANMLDEHAKERKAILNVIYNIVKIAVNNGNEFQGIDLQNPKGVLYQLRKDKERSIVSRFKKISGLLAITLPEKIFIGKKIPQAETNSLIVTFSHPDLGELGYIQIYTDCLEGELPRLIVTNMYSNKNDGHIAERKNLMSEIGHILDEIIAC